MKAKPLALHWRKRAQLKKTKEIRKIVNETIEKKLLNSAASERGCSESSLSSSDTPSKEGCLEDFANTVRKFIEKKYPSSILKPKLNDVQHSEEDWGYLKNVASNILGMTRQQLLVAKSIKISQSLRLAFIVITLNMRRIQGVQQSIDAYTVKESILQTPRIKVEEQQVRVVDRDCGKLEVTLQADRSKLQFELHGLKN